MTNRFPTLSRTLLVMAGAALFAAPAFADTISLSLASPNRTAIAGSTVSFSGTVAVSGNTSAINLDDFLNVPKPLTGSDDGFFNNVFFNSFNSGDSITALLFTVTLPSNLSVGIYNGSFQVYEDGNSSVSNTQNFSINIAGNSPVPEPGTWLLLATGLAIGGAAFALNGRRTRISAL